LHDKRFIWRYQSDVYEPELLRFGGPASTDLCHSIFHLQSHAVAGLASQGTFDPEVRLMHGVAGLEHLLSLGAAARGRTTDSLLCDMLPTATPAQFKQAARVARDNTDTPDSCFRTSAASSGASLEQLVTQLYELDASGTMWRDADAVLGVLAHLWWNRVNPEPTENGEIVGWRVLERLIRSQRARHV
jgi:thiopeptide-type bacteriocin biosynthesis protein